MTQVTARTSVTSVDTVGGGGVSGMGGYHGAKRMVEIAVPANAGHFNPNIPLSAKFVGVAEELLNFEEQVRIMQVDNAQLRHHHMMSVGYFMERAFDKVGRASLETAFDEWRRLLKTLRAERQFEEEQAGRRREGKEAKAELEKLLVLLEEEQLKNARIAAQVSEEQQRVELLKQENEAIVARSERFSAQLQEAEGCISHMQRAADLKVEAVRQDVMEYTNKSKALAASPIPTGSIIVPVGSGPGAALPASPFRPGVPSAGSPIRRVDERGGASAGSMGSADVEELKNMVSQLRRKVSGIDAAVSHR